MVFYLPRSLLPTWSRGFSSGAACPHYSQDWVLMLISKTLGRRRPGAVSIQLAPSSSTSSPGLSSLCLLHPVSMNRAALLGRWGCFFNPAPFPSACRVPAGGFGSALTKALVFKGCTCLCLHTNKDLTGCWLGHEWSCAKYLPIATFSV